MKSMTGIFAVLSCLLLGVSTGCSGSRSEMPASEKSSAKTSVRREKKKESGPPMVVQQFMGCKAHR